MEPLTENKIVLIIRQTRLDELISRFNTLGQAKFYVEHLGADFSDYQREDDRYKSSIRQAEECLRKLGRVQVLKRTFLPNFVFSKNDIIVVLGQDGLVANTLKYLESQLVVAVNPDPDRWDGILLPFIVDDLPQIIPEVFSRKRDCKKITMAKAELNNGQVLYGVNDLFIGHKSHVSARYLLSIGSDQEQQSSSGIIVSTGLGATGWLKSVVTGAAGITGYVSGKSMQINRKTRISWDSEFLYYAVREPFPSKISEASLVFGKISKNEPMKIVSQMSDKGVIFSDGIESDFLEFNSGTLATINIAEKRGLLIV
ncbi:MAG: diacylglycerol kinase catalytic domain-containing protein [Planctomycetota bacterium]|jgi:NAD kinase